MAKAKLTNFAQVLRMLSALTDEEKATLRDVLRPEPQKRKTTKQASKRSRANSDQPPLLIAPEKPESADKPKAEKCYVCHEERDHSNHDSAYLSSHEFQSAPSKKRSKVEPEVSSGVAA